MDPRFILYVLLFVTAVQGSKAENIIESELRQISTVCCNSFCDSLQFNYFNHLLARYSELPQKDNKLITLSSDALGRCFSNKNIARQQRTADSDGSLLIPSLPFSTYNRTSRNTSFISPCGDAFGNLYSIVGNGQYILVEITSASSLWLTSISNSSYCQGFYPYTWGPVRWLSSQNETYFILITAYGNFTEFNYSISVYNAPPPVVSLVNFTMPSTVESTQVSVPVAFSVYASFGINSIYLYLETKSFDVVASVNYPGVRAQYFSLSTDIPFETNITIDEEYCAVIEVLDTDYVRTNLSGPCVKVIPNSAEKVYSNLVLVILVFALALVVL